MLSWHIPVHPTGFPTETLRALPTGMCWMSTGTLACASVCSLPTQASSWQLRGHLRVPNTTISYHVQYRLAKQTTLCSICCHSSFCAYFCTLKCQENHFIFKTSQLRPLYSMLARTGGVWRNRAKKNSTYIMCAVKSSQKWEVLSQKTRLSNKNIKYDFKNKEGWASAKVSHPADFPIPHLHFKPHTAPLLFVI